jgi:hypothetical protein
MDSAIESGRMGPGAAALDGRSVELRIGALSRFQPNFSFLSPVVD